MALDFSRVTVAGPLVSLVEAKQQLRIQDSDHDADVTAKMDAAQEAILAYLTTAGDETWDGTTVPKAVKQAILILLTHLYEHRGDDMSPTATGTTPDADVWAAIGRLLALYRDPTLK